MDSCKTFQDLPLQVRQTFVFGDGPLAVGIESRKVTLVEKVPDPDREYHSFGVDQMLQALQSRPLILGWRASQQLAWECGCHFYPAIRGGFQDGLRPGEDNIGIYKNTFRRKFGFQPEESHKRL
jgi:hypothetical protein